ncbi:MAG: glutaredoxin family protein [Acidobacteriaceae bacterium]|nr:glutaredoxin family protein [Acidobacteriaceae bacterium]
MATVTVYGADWCPLTKAALRHLDEVGVEYKYVDIDEDAEAAQWVANHNDGKEKKPTIDVEGEVLSEPSDAELDEVLRAKSVLT